MKKRKRKAVRPFYRFIKELERMTRDHPIGTRRKRYITRLFRDGAIETANAPKKGALEVSIVRRSGNPMVLIKDPRSQTHRLLVVRHYRR